MKTIPALVRVIILTLACTWLLSKAQAVNPLPDGGYPGGNTAEGQSALFSLTSGIYNTAVGFFSLTSNTEGQLNTATGAGSLLANTSDENTATGAGALLSNTTGASNTANGVFALFSNTTGNGNTAIGDSALFSNTEGGLNTAVGLNALLGNTTGVFNTAVGRGALGNETTGESNIALGAFAGNAVSTADNVIAIGTSGGNVDDSCYIGNIWNQPGGSQAVYVNSDGKLGAQVSSRRFKDEIGPMERVSEAIYSLKPVTFRYKPEIEPARPLGFGLIAEDVEKISPDLVTRGRDGQVNTVRYDAVNAMLLNEFLKEHRKVEQIKTTIKRQQEQIEALTAGLQKVTVQIEMKKRASQIANNR
jgi:Chaperone of endosialidase